jgi:hypothetical protein
VQARIQGFLEPGGSDARIAARAGERHRPTGVLTVGCARGSSIWQQDAKFQFSFGGSMPSARARRFASSTSCSSDVVERASLAHLATIDDEAEDFGFAHRRLHRSRGLTMLQRELSRFLQLREKHVAAPKLNPIPPIGGRGVHPIRLLRPIWAY